MMKPEARKAFRALLPWKQPISHYDSDGPRDEPVEFTIEGITMRVDFGKGELAPTTLRDRYRVVCLTCDKVVHRATTGATVRCEQHFEFDHKITEFS
jgi:hypothetical protein